MSGVSIAEFTRNVLQQWQSSPHNLLQILLQLQHRFHHIPAAAQQLISDQLQIPGSEIQRNIDFYGFLHQVPRGSFDILFSDNIIDQMQGSRQLSAQLAWLLNMPPNSSRADGLVSLGYTSCTGMSDQGPAILVNGRAMPALDREKIQRISVLVESDTPLEQWPADWFRVAPGIRQRGWLLNHAIPAGAAIRQLLQQGAENTLQVLQNSGLRGRGGAGFSTAAKWAFCKQATATDKVVVCNADEGEPGTFKDRALLQEYAEGVIEGMTVCAGVIGATHGFIYLRGEYAYLEPMLQQVLHRRRQDNLLGNSILQHQEFNFDIAIHLGAGAYICGEESALIESLEGKPGIPRIRPPFPVTRGYLDKPSVVNNVETLLAAAAIIDQGEESFKRLGTGESHGSKLLSISGDCAQPGIYEYPFGTSIAQILQDCGAKDTQLVQIAGPAGQCISAAEFERTIAFEDLATAGSFMIFNQSRELLQIMQNFVHFFRHESCGFCTPCRVGTGLLQKHIDTLVAGQGRPEELETISRIGRLMRNTSHCGLGHTAANPLLYSMQKFPGTFQNALVAAQDDRDNNPPMTKPEEHDESAAVY